jgi:hypothetical protein
LEAGAVLLLLYPQDLTRSSMLASSPVFLTHRSVRGLGFVLEPWK